MLFLSTQIALFSLAKTVLKETDKIQNSFSRNKFKDKNFTVLLKY